MTDMTDREKAEKALELLGYTKVKEGVWKHACFVDGQRIDTTDGPTVVMSLYGAFKQNGYEQCQNVIKRELGISE